MPRSCSLDGEAEVLSILFDQQRVPVYNLSIPNSPTYYVGQHGLWVHNCPPWLSTIGENSDLALAYQRAKAGQKELTAWLGKEIPDNLAKHIHQYHQPSRSLADARHDIGTAIYRLKGRGIENTHDMFITRVVNDPADDSVGNTQDYLRRN